MKKIFFLVIWLFIQPNITFSKPLPEGFADIISPLLPSVVSIASTTIIEEKKQQMPQFPEGSPFEDFLKNTLTNLKMTIIKDL